MNKFLSLLFVFVSFVTLSAQQKQVAMLEPMVVTGDVKVIEKAMVRGEMIKAICSTSGYVAFSRQDIDQIMNEHNFQQSGLVDDETRKRLGVMQGVDYLCVTKISKEDKNFYLEACLINIETGEISQPATKYGELNDGKLENMLIACRELALDLVKSSSDNEIAESNYDSDPVLTVAETMPEFPGGMAAMMQFISKTIIYPTDAASNGIQGRVLCQFVVNKDGSLSDVVVTRSSGTASLDAEAVRVIKEMPNWVPGKQRGELVRVKYTIPVSFRL